ncbi:MaoC family dehydratase [Azospirillum formosense]|uniref:MaoC family dehydratase n=1 Tax=Azospirillum formosense TaxID=861533 RepID=UPI001C90A514|nr:MaoC family dehydratase [Azospirillum formosense]MBY3757130.1 MaoC family dehydratase [Azospirillum formosense]
MADGTTTIDRLTPVTKRIDRAAIRLYAELTDDFNPIHVDPDFAAKTPMKGIIAHGLLSVNLLWQSVRRSLGDAAVSDATLDIRFLRPVREDDVVTAGGQRRADGDGYGYDVWITNQHGETVIAGRVLHPAGRAAS